MIAQNEAAVFGNSQVSVTTSKKVENSPMARMELADDLAGAMANQFNNIMMSISSFAELELKKAKPNEKRKLEGLLESSTRATLLVHRLLEYSRKHTSVPELICLEDVVRRVSRLLEPLGVSDGELSLVLSNSNEKILADANDIELAILSVGLQARQGAASMGKLTIETTTVMNESCGSTCSPLGDACVTLSVEETAPRQGSSHEKDAKMELILAAVRRIIQHVNGKVRISTRSHGGSKYKLLFPVVSSVAVAAKMPAEKAVPLSQTVLIVDDDAAICNATAEFLKMEGFKVLQARNGAEALSIVQKTPSNLDLLVTDIVMTGMNGTQLAEQLLLEHPELRVLYMSGDAGKSAAVAEGPKNHILQKPFRLDRLNNKIREILRS